MTGFCLQQADNCRRYTEYCNLDYIAGACSELCYPECANDPTDPPTNPSTTQTTLPPTTTAPLSREVFVDCSMSEPLEATYEGQAEPIREGRQPLNYIRFENYENHGIDMTKIFFLLFCIILSHL